MALGLSACSSGISLTYIPPVATENAYDYYRKISAVSAEQLTAERLMLESAVSVSADPASSVKLALLLSRYESNGPGNEAIAITLLEPYATSAQAGNLSSDYQALAMQWLELLQQRRKTREALQLQLETKNTLSQVQAAYGQLDARYLGLARVLASLEEQNSLLAQQNVLMQQQIEALTVIEQQLAERQQLQVQQ